MKHDEWYLNHTLTDMYIFQWNNPHTHIDKIFCSEIVIHWTLSTLTLKIIRKNLFTLINCNAFNANYFWKTYSVQFLVLFFIYHQSILAKLIASNGWCLALNANGLISNSFHCFFWALHVGFQIQWRDTCMFDCFGINQ